HRRLGAKMVPFGGWDMPLAYPSGTLAEHRACRQNAVAFDVSHLGTVRVEGPQALDHLQRILTNDLRKVGPGRAQYAHLLDDDGVECAVPADAAPSFGRAVLEAGFVPAGLGARDTLRLEAGLPLHGHELGPGITPLQAGLGWVVGWNKGDFQGRAALEAERQR